MHEIERKFLIDPNKIPVNLPIKLIRDIEQGYIYRDLDMRVRRENDRYFVMVKEDTVDPLIRSERSREIDKRSYDMYCQHIKSNVISKVRYDIVLRCGNIASIDFFKYQYQGLVMAEIEFSTPDNAAVFLVPEWFGEEVTNDPGYRNRNLAFNDKEAIV